MPLWANALDPPILPIEVALYDLKGESFGVPPPLVTKPVVPEFPLTSLLLILPGWRSDFPTAIESELSFLILSYSYYAASSLTIFSFA